MNDFIKPCSDFKMLGQQLTYKLGGAGMAKAQS